ncbi:hypothetical protein [Aquiflexum gelatinilyticum]|uniref:hypothetical protein n=1 Tax=Aquiflexum gelatinilyticum TaxID=2961943 RepID=UPI002169EC78|nr:hypothetical protein [Aquiflexum gelatinilyticum]MCS4433940.1 hypothetical protein [Aquiflexum gelatinilyticum]
MSAKVNSKYVENYAKEFSKKVCEGYFPTKKYMTGQDIITLTPSVQVNFFIIKTLFEAWQLELEKLKSNPFFDYRDKTVHEALREFMNVLSRTIKIERTHFEPLLEQSVQDSILLAVDPLEFYKNEFGKLKGHEINQYLKENKKYIKWHTNLITNLIDKAGLSYTHEAYQEALSNNFLIQKEKLESFKILLNSMGQVVFLDFDQIAEVDFIKSKSEKKVEAIPALKEADASYFDSLEEIKDSEFEIREDSGLKEEFEESLLQEEEQVLENIPTEKLFKTIRPDQGIDPSKVWARFENEQYSIMKGSIKELSESIGLNQRFMFTKDLFDGNPDLLKHALKSIDECESFVEAIHLLNERYVGELGWNKDSDVVDEFLQLIFRKFDVRG